MSKENEYKSKDVAINGNGGISAADIAWKMFKKSGNINYYRLYSDLKKKDE